MKFKGIELKETEAEFLISIELTKLDYNLEKYVEELEDSLEDIFENSNHDIYVEEIYDNLLNVRCDDITFDSKGVKLLTEIYTDIVTSDLQNVKVMINVHVDGKEWFKKEDGLEYNEDSVTLEEFLLNIEYQGESVAYIENIVIGTPIVDPKDMFASDEDDWKSQRW